MVNQLEEAKGEIKKLTEENENFKEKVLQKNKIEKNNSNTKLRLQQLVIFIYFFILSNISLGRRKQSI